MYKLNKEKKEMKRLKGKICKKKEEIEREIKIRDFGTETSHKKGEKNSLFIFLNF
jgi:hypothetical protein